MRLGSRRVGWYWRRLRAMSPAEVAYRLRHQLILRQERQEVRRGRTSWPIPPSVDGALFSRFFFDTPTPFSPENTAATVAVADDLLAGRITLFGQHLTLPEPVDWHRDPLTERNWPAVFHADVDTRDGQTIGGVKWVWELNRHHHLVTLAKAYALTKDERYAAAVCRQLASWLDQNPPLMGVNWTSALELALRLFNWTWALAFLRGSSQLSDDLLRRILGAMMAQAAYIQRHLSGFSSANNHLVGEAAGLALMGLCFPRLPSAESWRKTGLSILERELARQILPDGVPAEQAISYLVFVLDFNLHIWRLASLSDLPVPPIWHERLAAAVDFLHHITDQSGQVPAIGDSDDAWVVRLDDRRDAHNLRSLLASAALLLSRADLKAAAGGWDEKSQWLWGGAGQVAFETLPANPVAPVSRLFPDGGYGIMRAADSVLIFDVGPLGFGSLAAHGHADALSLWLTVGSTTVLTDAGTFAYQEGGPWRDYFRGTAAHNTVIVDDQDQSEIQGAFLWGRKAQAEIVRWETAPEYDLAVAEHNGYAHLGVRHRRTVLFRKPDALLVVDDLLGSGTHHLQQLWHLPISSQVDYTGRSAAANIDAVIGQRRFRFVSCGEQPVSRVTFQGEKSPRQGWVSERYGHMAPAPAIAFELLGPCPIRLQTLIWLAPVIGESAPTASLLRLLSRLRGFDQ